MLLESYAQGRWHAPKDEGEPLLDASTGDEVARFGRDTGLDLGAVLEHGRRVGGPALRAMTFHERAGVLKQLATHLQSHSEELYALSAMTGATKRDSDVDVGGGIGTLFAYSSKARRELPNSTVYVDGPVESLSRGGTFVAQHIMTPLRGVAVQVNAFNFPVWGVLEKLAPAFVAGVPTVVKPAPQTAYVTERLVRVAVESGLLPEGSLQLVSGPPGDLLDHLTEQDLLSFTGSAATAAVLRAHPAVVSRNVRFNAEADSLNACVLGPDAGQKELELFTREVFREMTGKAGQKCTAIRRAFVPAARVDDVVAGLRDRLGKVVVGDPRDEATTMGALVSLQQRDAVRRSVAALGGDVVVGDPGFELGRGAFLEPLLLLADVHSGPVHEVEAFGPVCSVLPYSASDDVPELLARGRGSLVATVVTADPAFAREVVLGAAAYHGRVHVLDSSCAKESTGHGSPMPALVHGGPGRAGGGEELGGIRGVLHHLQRTAVQGSPATIAAVTGRWVPGAPRVEDGVHPFRKTLGELAVGDSVRTAAHEVTQEEIDRFVELTGDSFYAHTDPVAAAANPLFGGIVAHGYLVLSLAAGLFVDPAPGPVLANYGLDSLRFVTPVKPGDVISVVLTCKEKNPRDGADYGEVRWDAEVTNAEGAVVAHYELLTMVAR
ncbi:MAG: phenylacetic acid degradation bifunctional protein PaaZ [Mycobacteriales bacterium]|nr:phenylacetic acid degradation bifunctional protein PaaZ [Mycobacteriales bacterium]